MKSILKNVAGITVSAILVFEIMGCSPKVTPNTMVEITGCPTGDFYISNTELTYARWYEVYHWAEENGYMFQNLGDEGNDDRSGKVPKINSRQPVTWVSWRDAIVWCNAASEMEGLTPVYEYNGSVVKEAEYCVEDLRTNIKNTTHAGDGKGKAENAIVKTDVNGYRLPTGTEWVYAAKGGQEYTYSGSDNIDEVAWKFEDKYKAKTHDVGTKAKNGYELYDMSGNVYEWCQDLYRSNIEKRMVRGGGSWTVDEYYGDYAGCPDWITGFRVVRSIPKKDYNPNPYPDPLEDFVLLPAGTFQMGSNHPEMFDPKSVQVTLTKAFYMCDHEVTQAEYKAVMGTNPSFYKTGVANGEVQENRPVESVSWYMAIVYCNKRSMTENLTPCYTINGKTNPQEWGPIPYMSDEIWDKVECNWNVNGYRLPTEEEWEYAARAGDTTVDSYTWSGTNAETSLGDYAWYKLNEGEKTHEVKKKHGNANELYDMSGNVDEWCWYVDALPDDPHCVSRGGYFGSAASGCAVSRNFYDFPYYQGDNLGFRVVRSSTN